MKLCAIGLTVFFALEMSAQSWDSLLQKADSLAKMRDYENAVVKYLAAVNSRDSLNMEQDSLHAHILHSVGACYARIWQFAQSQKYIKLSLALRERLFPPTHPQIAVSLVVLAYVTSDESYQEAEGMYQRAISIFEANPAHASSDTTLLQQYAGALLNTGLLNSNYGKYKEALGYYDKALAAYKASVGFESEPVAKLLNQIGNVHWYASDFETAGRYYEQALAIHRKTVGSFDRDLGMSLNNIAAVYNKLGRYAEAEQYLQESIHIKERLYGPTSGQVASGLINLAYNCARQGKFNEAKPLHQQGSYYERQHVGPYAKEYGFTLEGASPLYRAWGDYDSSIYFAEAAVDLRKRIYRNLSVVFSEKDIFSHSIFLRNAVDIALSAYLDHPRPEVLARAITHIIGGKEHLADELWARREICCGS